MATVTGAKRKLSIDIDSLEAKNVLTLGGNTVATQSWVTSTIVDGAPDALNTLNELAAAINDTSNYASTVTTALGNRLRIDAAQGLNATQQSQGRSNLGLGTAATSNVGDFASSTHNHDSAYWRTARSISLTGSNPFDDAKTETRVTGTGNYVISYTGASAQLISSATGGSASIFQIGAHYNGSDFYMRTRTDSTTWQTWKKLWHTGNFDPNTKASTSVFTSTANGLVPLSGGGTTKYLRADGTWVVPPDTNTWRPIDDTPVDGATTESISSNWAFDHVNATNPHGTTASDVGAAPASHDHDGRYMRMDADTHTTGGIEIRGSLSRGTYTTASQYHTGADNIVLKGNSVGISGIFFESEKDGTNINHPSDFGFIQYHAYGTTTSGEANELVIGVSNDADDHVVLNAPNVNGLKFRTGSSETDYTIWHSGNFDPASKAASSHSHAISDVTGLQTALDGKQAAGSYAAASHTHDDRYYTESESNSRFASRAFKEAAYVDFTVDGDANTYYPVRIGGSSMYGFHKYSVSRRYSWPAPDTWNTATHRGGLTLTFEWSGDTAWGGNHKPIRVIEFGETYTNMVGGLTLPVTGGAMVWLRGGGALYRLHTPNGAEAFVSVELGGFTAGNGAVYSPRNADEASTGRSNDIYGRWPVRGTSELYDGTSRVATQSWVSGQGYLTSLPSHNHDSTYLKLTGGTLSDDLTVSGGRIVIKRGTGLTHTEWEDDSTAGGRGQLILDSHYSDLIIASRNTNANKHGSTLTFATQSTSTNDVAKWVIGQGQYQEGADHLAFAYGINQTNPHSILGTDNANASFVIMNGGKVVIGGTTDKNAYSSTASTRLMFGGADADAEGNYYIGTNKENYGGDYTKLDLRWHTGIRMGAQPSYGGIRFFDSEDLGRRIMSIGETDANVRIDNNLWIGGAGGWITDLLNSKLSTSGKAADANLLDGLDSSRFLYTTTGTFSGDWNTLTDTNQEIRLVEVHNITGGAHSNYPTGVYTYGSVLGWQLDNATFKLYAAHTGDLAYQTGWNNDGYSGWRTLIHSGNIGTQTVASANVALSVQWNNILSKPSSFAPSAHTHDIGDVTGLREALDAKQPVGSYAGANGTYNNDFYVNALYYDDWVRNHTNTNGIYWSTTGWHLYPIDNDDFRVRSGNTSSAALRFNTGGTDRNYVYCNSSNEIGFLNTSRSWIFRVTNTGTATATGDVVAFSDRRLKDNIETIPNALEKVEAMRGVTFTRKDTGKESIGLIAQEVEEVIPEVVNNEGEYKGVAYGNLVGVLIEAIKELSAEVKELKAKLGE